MSIYVVRLAEWFPPGDKDHAMIKWICSSGISDHGRGCLFCGKKRLHWQKAMGHHSLLFGYGDLFCNERHYRRYWEDVSAGGRSR